jgi:RHS repeat-associated protein
VLAHEVVRDARAGGDPVIEEKTYWFEEGTFAPVAQRAGGEWFHFINDPIGAPEQLVDDAGEVACVVQRTAWGHADPAPDSRTTTQIRFPGQYEDDDIGLSYNRARYYSPELARFISPDPVGLRGGTNEYRYPRNPLLHQDPLGLTSPSATVSAVQRGYPPPYGGIDDWHDTVLPKGAVIAMGEPGVSGFATTPEAVHSCGDSRSKVFQGVQVAPSTDPAHPGYRPRMGLYQLNEPTPVAASLALANANVTTPPSAGGLPQYYIPDWQSKLSSGAMTRVGEIPLGP